MRRQADFDNYRKRIEKERREDGQRATARVIEELIPVVDGFEHALAAHREAEYDSYRKGFELIYKQLAGQCRTPWRRTHRPARQTISIRICTRPWTASETAEHPDGTILEVFQPGYVFHGRVLRPAMVRVAVHPRAASNRSRN